MSPCKCRHAPVPMSPCCCLLLQNLMLRSSFLLRCCHVDVSVVAALMSPCQWSLLLRCYRHGDVFVPMSSSWRADIVAVMSEHAPHFPPPSRPPSSIEDVESILPTQKLQLVSECMTKACWFKGAATMDPIITRNSKNKNNRIMDKRK